MIDSFLGNAINHPKIGKRKRCKPFPSRSREVRTENPLHHMEVPAPIGASTNFIRVQQIATFGLSVNIANSYFQRKSVVRTFFLEREIIANALVYNML